MDEHTPQRRSQLPGGQVPTQASLWPGREFPLAWLVGLGLLIIVLRLPFMGHLVSWDEAWNLCALKSLAGGGGEDFSLQFWRHPPIYLLLGRLLDPLRAGLDFRMQLLSLALSSGTILAFVVLVARLFGRPTALYTGLAYSLLPGALFFDTWIKHDPVASLFGTLALLASVRRKNWLAGFLLGLAFLGKETAVYYAAALFLFPFLVPHRKTRLRGVCVVYGLAAGVSCWWYLRMAAAGGNFLAMFLGTSFEASQFIEPWWYFLDRLRVDLGLAGLALFAAGLVALCRRSGGHKQPWRQRLLRPRLLPLTILVPVYLLLSFSKAKPAWMTMGLYPPLALLVGCGWLLVSKKGAGVGRAFLLALKPRRLPGVALSGLFLLLLLGVPSRDYLGQSGYQRLYGAFAPKSLKLMQAPYCMAEALNSLAREGEKLVILPMLYRGAPDVPDPIFFWQLKVPLVISRVSKESKIDYQMLREIIIKEKVGWLLMSPRQGSDQRLICEQFSGSENPPQAYILPYTVLLKVNALWRDK